MSDEPKRPETLAERISLMGTAFVSLIDPASMMIIATKRRKRKGVVPVDYPVYFYSDEELAFMEQMDQFAAHVAATGWTVEEAAEALSLLALYGDE